MGRPAQEGGGDPAQVEPAGLQEPMAEALTHLEDLIREANRGDLKAVRGAYSAFGTAFGRVLPPLSFRDGEQAQRLANAHTGLRELLSQPRAEEGALIKQAGHLRAALQDAASAMGLSLTLPATAQGEEEQRVITVTALGTEFRPTLIEVKAGTKVTVRVVNQGAVACQWQLEGHEAALAPIQPGESAEVTFVAGKPGTYEYFSAIGDQQGRGLRGFLRVSAR